MLWDGQKIATSENVSVTPVPVGAKIWEARETFPSVLNRLFNRRATALNSPRMGIDILVEPTGIEVESFLEKPDVAWGIVSNF